MRWARGSFRFQPESDDLHFTVTFAHMLWCAVNKMTCTSNAGDYYSGPPGDLDQEPDEQWVKSRENEGRAYQEWDEDADVDESGEVFFSVQCSLLLATKIVTG